jgi:oxygen-dependent protoporphyrinogen oxidase
MPHRIAVVGAGLAGLTAAFRLERAGARVTVLEAGERSGGRLMQDTLADVSFEPCLPFVPTAAPALSGLLQELGIADAVSRAPIAHVREWRTGSSQLHTTRAETSWLPWRSVRARRLRTLLHWFGPLLDPRAPERAVRLDDRSVGDFARLYLRGDSLEQRFEPLLERALGQDPDETSRALLMLLMNSFGDVELSRISGLAALTVELAKRLTDVRTGARVTAIAPDGRNVEVEAGDDLSCDAVVLATRGDEARALAPALTPPEQLCLDELHYGARLHVALAVRAGSEPSEPFTWLPPDEGRFLTALVDATPDPAAERRVLIGVARPEAMESSDDSLRDAALDVAERVQPGVGERVLETRVYRLDHALPQFHVGHYRGVARLLDEQREHFPSRRVRLCGDYLVGPHAEGAVVSATRTAYAVLDALDQLTTR